jgi:serine/threonine protein kinase
MLLAKDCWHVLQVLVDSDKSSGLTVIKYTFIEGDHAPKTVGQVVEVVKQLARLHSRGIVHGDVRAFNIVFGPQSRLIDFDLAGTAGTKRYPSGYNSNTLVDSQRHQDAKAGELLQKEHDRFSLAWILDKFVPIDENSVVKWTSSVSDLRSGEDISGFCSGVSPEVKLKSEATQTWTGTSQSGSGSPELVRQTQRGTSAIPLSMPPPCVSSSSSSSSSSEPPPKKQKVL